MSCLLVPASMTLNDLERQ